MPGDDQGRDQAREVRDFASVLLDINRGGTHAELSEALAGLVSAVQDTGRPGALTFTLRVEPLRGQRHAVVLSDKVSVKTPEFDRPSSVFFADATGSLSRDDPRQPSLLDQTPSDQTQGDHA